MEKEREEKVMQKNLKKKGLNLMARNLKFAKRGGLHTPPPAWKVFEDEDGDDMQGILTRNNNYGKTLVSARQLCASLWGIQPLFLKMGKRHFPQTRHKKHSQSFHNVLESLNQSAKVSVERKQNAALPLQQCNSGVVNPVVETESSSSSGSSMEVTPYKPAVWPNTLLEYKEGTFESCNKPKTSTELLKVLRSIWSLEEQHASNQSLLKSLKAELEHARAKNKELVRERQKDKKIVDGLIKQIAEYKLIRKQKERSYTKTLVDSVREELETERKLRKHSAGMHRKLAREVAEVKSQFMSTMEALERERHLCSLMESLCDEFAKGIRDYDKLLWSVKQKADESLEGREDNVDRYILHISESYLDGRIQMKLAEERNNFNEKKKVLEKLTFDIETFVQAAKSNKSIGVGSCNGKKLGKSGLTQRSFESFPLNEIRSASLHRGDSDTQHAYEMNVSCSGSEFQCKDQITMKGRSNARKSSSKSVSSKSTPGGVPSVTDEKTSKNASRSDHCFLRNDSISIAGNEIYPVNDCQTTHQCRPHQMQIGIMEQQRVSKFVSPGSGKSESVLRFPLGVRENSLMVKLIEARIEGRHSLSKASNSSI